MKFSVYWTISLLILLLTACAPDMGLAYLVPQGKGGDIWLLKGSENYPVTSTNGFVYDYSVSMSGGSIIFSEFNGKGGLDVCQAGINGKNEALILDCGLDWCFEGALSPDEKLLAYSRLEWETSAPGSVQSRIWLLDIHSGTTQPLFMNTFIAGETPIWSPVGSHLAFYDPLTRGIRVIDMSDGQSQFLASDFASGAWSPDGTRIAFVDLVQMSVEDTISRLYIADIRSQQIYPVYDETAQIDYSVPAWSPDGEWLAVGWRYTGGPPGKQIKLVNVNSGEEIIIAEDLTFSHTSYMWSRDGSELVYQKVRLGDSQARPEIWVWDREGKKNRLLIQNAAFPKWTR